MTEDAKGKATGWSAWYQDGKWQAKDTKKKK
jgi:Topoisomerase I zinc-ribbon-like.